MNQDKYKKKSPVSPEKKKTVYLRFSPKVFWGNLYQKLISINGMPSGIIYCRSLLQI